MRKILITLFAIVATATVKGQSLPDSIAKINGQIVIVKPATATQTTPIDTAAFNSRIANLQKEVDAWDAHIDMLKAENRQRKARLSAYKKLK